VTRLALLLAAAALVAPPGASAKELVRATICGASGCRTVRDQATLNEIPSGETVTPLGAPAPYYRFELVGWGPDGRRSTVRLEYVPSKNGVVWVEDGRAGLHPIYGDRAKGVMRRLTAGLDPYVPPGSRESQRALPWTWIALAAIGLAAAILLPTRGRPWRPPSRAAPTERSAG
jgi:hypothetical protein